jgi:DNA protecting protein DprA
MTQEIPYWLALANLPKWGPIKTMNLIIRFYHESRISLVDFLHLSEYQWKDEYNLSQQEIDDLMLAKSELPNYAFLAESMLNEGYEVLPVISPEYPKTLKENLKLQAPLVLYIKGNKQILQEKSIAIVGSRSASDYSLQFTDNVAKSASREYKVIVSGFAKGVDKQALDSAIKYKGQSIIVLPQGIMTFGSGFKKYYRQIVDGDVLVLSTFHPKAPWKVELAMARNPVIYGLACEIFVAESNDKGGTWSGVIDGLRKNRKIFVRKPEANEKNANDLLIEKGAIPVDFDGKPIENYQVDPHPVSNATVNEAPDEADKKSKRRKSKSDPQQGELFGE